MVRTYKKKTDQGQWSQEDMNKAADKVLTKKLSVRQAAETYNVPYTSLQRRTTLSRGVIKRRGGQQTMDIDTEKQFADRLLHLSNRGFGITPKAVRKYAFQFAECKNIKHSFNKKTEIAGEDWFHRFMTRNPELSIRKPEGLSRARINGMKKEKVTEFFKTLENVVEHNDLRGKPECVYNVDETGVPLNNRPPNIVAKKGSKDVVSMTSVERGENVTVLACMNAAGQYIPPFVLFKGVRKRDDFMLGMPSGTEIAMTEKGWVTEEAFKLWLHHFNRYRTQGKVILILDGHATHTSFAVVDLCESLEIELVLIPPHTSHALQPLDVSFFKPLKAYYNQHATTWQHSHPHKGITKVAFGGLFKEAWNQAATVGNAAKGFQKTGIFPLNPNAIPDHKFIGDIQHNVDTPQPNVQQRVDLELPSTSARQVYDEQSSTRKQLIQDPPLQTRQFETEQQDCDGVTSDPIKEILPSPLKSPTISRKPHKLTQPILHLTSPQSKENLLMKETKKKEKIEKKKSGVKEKEKNKENINIKKKNKATPGIKIKSSVGSRDWLCIFCSEKFVHPPTEDWIQCSACEEWCHENCADRNGAKGPYTCDLCADN